MSTYDKFSDIENAHIFCKLVQFLFFDFQIRGLYRNIKENRSGWILFFLSNDGCAFLFKIKDMSGWYLTDISGHVRVAPQQDLQPPHHISISSGEARRALAPDYFWSAPAPYLGNKVSPYAACFSPLCFNRSIKEWALFSICLKKDKHIKHILCQIA